jgi:hypothetical protein
MDREGRSCFAMDASNWRCGHPRLERSARPTRPPRDSCCPGHRSRRDRLPIARWSSGALRLEAQRRSETNRDDRLRFRPSPALITCSPKLPPRAGRRGGDRLNPLRVTVAPHGWMPADYSVHGSMGDPGAVAYDTCRLYCGSSEIRPESRGGLDRGTRHFQTVGGS